MAFLSDQELERSAVVANCRMNRERNLVGSNGYDRELGFHPFEFLRERVVADTPIEWLDLCCGTGRALIQASGMVRENGLSGQVRITGVDLAGMFDVVDPALTCLRLVEGSIRSWTPDCCFALITCVHGLHYIGDKLGLLSRAVSWLGDDGMLVANLDLANLRVEGRRAAGRAIVADLRQHGLEYHRKKRLIVCRGRSDICLPYRYLGGCDDAGPNYTGQPAVNSYYAEI